MTIYILSFDLTMTTYGLSFRMVESVSTTQARLRISIYLCTFNDLAHEEASVQEIRGRISAGGVSRASWRNLRRCHSYAHSRRGIERNDGVRYKRCYRIGRRSPVIPMASSWSGSRQRKPPAACSTSFSSSAPAARRSLTSSGFRHRITKSLCGCAHPQSRLKHSRHSTAESWCRPCSVQQSPAEVWVVAKHPNRRLRPAPARPRRSS